MRVKNYQGIAASTTSSFRISSAHLQQSPSAHIRIYVPASSHLQLATMWRCHAPSNLQLSSRLRPLHQASFSSRGSYATLHQASFKLTIEAHTLQQIRARLRPQPLQQASFRRASRRGPFIKQLSRLWPSLGQAVVSNCTSGHPPPYTKQPSILPNSVNPASITSSIAAGNPLPTSSITHMVQARRSMHLAAITTKWVQQQHGCPPPASSTSQAQIKEANPASNIPHVVQARRSLYPAAISHKGG